MILLGVGSLIIMVTQCFVPIMVVHEAPRFGRLLIGDMSGMINVYNFDQDAVTWGSGALGCLVEPIIKPVGFSTGA